MDLPVICLSPCGFPLPARVEGYRSKILVLIPLIGIDIMANNHASEFLNFGPYGFSGEYKSASNPLPVVAIDF